MNIKPRKVDEKEVLLNLKDRPAPEKVQTFSREGILDAAQGKFPIDLEGISKISAVHEVILPVMERMVHWLLKKEEPNTPSYYVFARDGEMLYDALWGVGQTKEKGLNTRVNLLKTSNGMRLSEEYHQGSEKYFERMGLTESRYKEGPKIVFIDSGFVGSLFEFTMNSIGVPFSLRKNFKGYLVSKGRGKFTQFGFSSKRGLKLSVLKKIFEIFQSLLQIQIQHLEPLLHRKILNAG